jgi:hypothetical protein
MIFRNGEMAGLNAFCEMLKVNTALHSIECASQIVPHFCGCFTPLGPHDGLAPLLHSLAGNFICTNGNEEGLNALCESLKDNTTLQSIKCAS